MSTPVYGNRLRQVPYFHKRSMRAAWTVNNRSNDHFEAADKDGLVSGVIVARLICDLVAGHYVGYR